MYHPFPHTPNILIILYAPITPLFRIILFSPLCFFACTFSFYKPYKSIESFALFCCIAPHNLYNPFAPFHFISPLICYACYCRIHFLLYIIFLYIFMHFLHLFPFTLSPYSHSILPQKNVCQISANFSIIIVSNHFFLYNFLSKAYIFSICTFYIYYLNTLIQLYVLLSPINLIKCLYSINFLSIYFIHFIFFIEITTDIIFVLMYLVISILIITDFMKHCLFIIFIIIKYN